ncbi:MAG: TauD/TfdA family dioxygenase, partial [Pseudomonadota bacterium]|nr:TauD/TfdA family dioxygenase [Pseudomonadota bacterium]
MRTHSLANGFAIQIEDVDLAAALDDDQLVAFTERFGPLFVHAQSSLLTTYKRKEVMELSNLDGVPRPVDYELDWHTDQTYPPQPVFGTILYGIVAPQEGGQTLFCDLA